MDVAVSDLPATSLTLDLCSDDLDQIGFLNGTELKRFIFLCQDCTICMEALAGPSGYKGPGVGGISRAESVGRLAQCGHQYHLQCLVAMYNNGNKDGSLQCPTCKTIYGVKTGNQPPGKMEYHVIPHSLPGHPDCKTIRIIYNIPPGIQVESLYLAAKEAYMSLFLNGVINCAPGL